MQDYPTVEREENQEPIRVLECENQLHVQEK